MKTEFERCNRIHARCKFAFVNLGKTRFWRQEENGGRMKTEFERCNGVAARCMFTFAKLGDSEVCGKCGGRADLFGRLSCLHLKDCRRKTRRLKSPLYFNHSSLPVALFALCPCNSTAQSRRRFPLSCSLRALMQH